MSFMGCYGMEEVTAKNVSFNHPLIWNADGSLSSIDMARILSHLEKTNLTECELSCNWGTSSYS
tara:strand:+ start:215 stop:406 length:192 start_codon:yes stop_codon:yes gene_type:complete